jgi:hypothetical protein
VDVYLVPIGRGRFELYCEPGDEPQRPEADAATGFWRRWADRFAAVLAAVEREHEAVSHKDAPAPRGAWARLRVRLISWTAEKVAEQRLLWRLRGKSQVLARIPDGLDEERAHAVIRGTLSSEFSRHRWWLAVDLLGGLAALALTPIPGPNVVGFYFTFRIVGHFFALRGARHGLTEVRWNLEPSVILSELGGLDGVPEDERERRVQAVAERLGLPRLGRFYSRVAVWAA